MAAPDPSRTSCSALTARGLPCKNRCAGGACGVHKKGKPEDEECPVCLASMQRRATATMACGHRFHSRCLRSWFRGRALTCPMCRTPCVEGLALLVPRLAPRLHALMRTVPPPPRAFFPSYIIAQLENPRVAEALGLDKARVELLIDVACECFTRDNFFAKVKALGL